MTRQTDLFAITPERPYSHLADELWQLARDHHIYLGSSSWKYESWRGEIYTDHYTSKKDFEQNCLEEYARTFPAVGGDFSFYNWPSTELITTIDKQTPDGFKIGLKATEFVTLRRFPNIGRWGAKAGKDNPDFLNAELFKREFLDRVSTLADKRKLAPIILEFTAFPRQAFNDWTEFASMLEKFFCVLAKLCGRECFEFGVELRTKEYLHDEFYAALKAINEHLPVAPILNSWTRMPPVDEQWKLFPRHEFPFSMSRLVMRPGRTRDEAVELFEPYDKLRERVLPARKSMRTMIEWAKHHGRPCYIFVNNHLEGCAFQTIAAVSREI